MFRVSDVRKSAGTTKTSSVKNVRGGENFADYLRSVDTREAGRLQATETLVQADAIFAAQMVDDEEEKQIKAKLVKKGNKLLEYLEDIRTSLLSGEIDKDKLIEISRLVKQKDVTTEDLKLREIMEEIELRVEVELAKLMR